MMLLQRETYVYMHVNKKLDAKSIPHVEKNFADNFSEVINSKSRKTTKPRITKRQTEIHFFIEYVICFELMSVITISGFRSTNNAKANASLARDEAVPLGSPNTTMNFN